MRKPGKKGDIAFIETELSIISIIGRAFSTLWGQPFLYLALGVLSLLPMTMMWVLAPSMAGYLEKFVNLLCGTLVSAAIAYAVYQSFQGRETGLGEVLTQGLKSFANLAILALLVNTLIFLGALLLIIPGIIVACMCAVAVPACVVEGLSPTDSAVRSLNLTQDYRLKIFFILLIYFAGLLLLTIAGQKAAPLISSHPAIQIVISNLILVIPQALYGIIIALIYSDLRLIKEGISMEKLAEIF